jgi:hypothetical protein
MFRMRHEAAMKVLNRIVSAHARLRSLCAMAVGFTILSSSADAQTAQRVLRIGVVDGAPEYTFGRISGIAILPDSGILVVDASNARARVFDQAGAFRFAFGRSGSGPGEFGLPIAPVVTPDGILIYDMSLQRLSTFDHHGTYVGSEPFHTDLPRINSIRPLRHGKWLASAGGLDGSEIVELRTGQRQASDVGLHTLYLLDSARVDTVARFRSGSVFWYDAAGMSFGPHTGRSSGSELHWNASGDSLVILVDATRGRVRWYSVESEALSAIAERNLDLPVRDIELPFLDSLAAAVRRRHGGISRVGFIRRAHAPYFNAALVDPQGRAWLRKAKPDGSLDEMNPTYLVLDMDGDGSFEVTFPSRFSLGAFAVGLAFGIRRDDLDVQFVEAYRLSRQARR